MQSAEGSIKRVVAFRLAPGEDVLEGLRKACETYRIKNGVILSGIGSLKGVRFYDPVPLPHKKAGYGYSDPIEITEPVELVTASGMICQSREGETLFHVHIGFSMADGTGRGGHLIEGNRVLLTVDMVIGEIDGMTMGRRYDEDLEVYLFHPYNQI